MGEDEHMTLRDLGFDFGPDPFGDKAAAAAIDAFLHSGEFVVLCGLALICLAYWYWIHRRARAERGDAVVIGMGREVQFAQRRAFALKDLKARDLFYDEDAFRARAVNAFLRVQEAWSRHDLAPARAFISDGMHERLSRQIAAQDEAGVRHVLRDTKVLESQILGYAAGWHYDSVTVRFKVGTVRARLAVQTKAVLEAEEALYEEIWTFLRRPGAKTLAQAGAIEGFCPSCGAPVSIVDAVRCGSCKTWINSGEHDWVAVESTAPWEWRFPDPRRDITGWATMRDRDPALSLESLEDRAAVAFWRWIEARRKGARGPLRGVATTELVEALALGEPLAGDALLGAVEVVAFEPGDDFDRAHAQVRWELGRERRTDYLVFKRRSGATSDLKAGLSTTRCPGCGAPPERIDLAACAYCALPFNDGSRGWTLAEIAPFGVWERPEEAPKTNVLPGADWGDELAPADAVAALASCLAADGGVHYREVAYLDAYAQRRGVSAGQVEKIVEQARAGRLPYAPPAGSDGALLRGLIRMSLVDGFVDDGERALLAQAARRAGLHDLELKEMIKEERAVLAARARELLRRLG